ncbi:hypothetical protein GGS23DRAFT_553505 [Durotheca rogersii]|uniref:uncharacterized protein n=1 Tax=Durotheca rogersii TaxID=419775 RepID=UPI00221E6C05|nr:uncharacterized protein GGS23DRAFT_553505 [Durotheca rogersii]KAI5867090.1 hypothetical protein GGS23DRAFT_553505 [Durotheca rogersii]
MIYIACVPAPFITISFVSASRWGRAYTCLPTMLPVVVYGAYVCALSASTPSPLGPDSDRHSRREREKMRETRE